MFFDVQCVLQGPGNEASVHVLLQLELSTGHRGMHPQGMLSTQAPSLTLRCCEGGMEGMGEMESLVHVGLQDKGESKE